METKKLTPLQAVREKCKDCCGDLKEARKCTSPECALYHHRAGKKDGSQTMSASKAMKEYCKQCCNGSSREANMCTATICPIYILKKQKEELKKQKEMNNA